MLPPMATCRVAYMALGFSQTHTFAIVGLMIKHARTLIVFTIANLLSLAISIVLAVLVSLPFALLGGFLVTWEADQSTSVQTDVAMAVQGAGVLVGVYGGFLAAFFLSLVLVFARVSRIVDKRFFPQAASSKTQRDT